MKRPNCLGIRRGLVNFERLKHDRLFASNTRGMTGPPDWQVLITCSIFVLVFRAVVFHYSIMVLVRIRMCWAQFPVAQSKSTKTILCVCYI
jgi:hypothetical protein